MNIELEYNKCKEDPKYFINNYVKIDTKDEGITNFTLRDYQEKMIDIFKNEKISIIHKARQIGGSKTSLAFILWYSIFNSNKTVVICCNKLALAKEQLYDLKYMHYNLPDFLKVSISSDKKTIITLENETTIRCISSSEDSIRGYTIDMLYLDEFAWLPEHITNSFMDSIFPVMNSTNSKLIIVSTSNGKNKFYHLLKRAMNIMSNMKYVEIPYYLVKDWNNYEWRAKMVQMIGELKFRQYYECEFLDFDREEAYKKFVSLTHNN